MVSKKTESKRCLGESQSEVKKKENKEKVKVKVKVTQEKVIFEDVRIHFRF